MNTGIWWTVELQKKLMIDFQKKDEKESVLCFCERWGKENNRGAESCRNKLRSLLKGGRITDNIPAQKPEKQEKQEKTSYEQTDKYIHIVCASTRMRSVDDVIEEFKVDMNMWRVDKFKIHPSEGYRKDRKVEWKVVDGKVIHGDVNDTGKMLVVPLYSFEVSFIRKTEEVRARAAALDIIADAKNYAPRYPKIKYEKQKHGVMYEISTPDLHFGRLTWEEETGEDYDIKIAAKMVHSVLDKLLTYAKLFPIERILLPIGNDFFNVNSKGNITVNGTIQQEDTRWQKTFRAGWHLIAEMIEKCSSIANVDVLVVKGNHDEERTFYMGEVLDAWFGKNPNVSVDNRARGRKYYQYGKNLLGFVHGCDIKIDALVSLMPLEVPDMWSKSMFREWHIGHVHHTYKLNNDAMESLGVVVRSLRSLVPADAWTFDHGFVGALRAAESFVWDAENGLVAQFTAMP